MSDTTRARKLKLKTNCAKVLASGTNFFCYVAYRGHKARNQIYTGFLHFSGIAEEAMDVFR